jgi:hypothetical protein
MSSPQANNRLVGIDNETSRAHEVEAQEKRDDAQSS